VPAEHSHVGGFAALHPAVSIGYFMPVIGVSVFVLHPVLLACSVLGALVLCLQLRGGRNTAKLLTGLVPLALVAAALNPLFNHQGVTIIGHIGGNPVTRESLLYGAALASMLIAVLLWFTCYNQVVTTEKFLATFGRIIPSLALVITMALRFVPRYLRQLKAIATAQRGLGHVTDTPPGRVLSHPSVIAASEPQSRRSRVKPGMTEGSDNYTPGILVTNACDDKYPRGVCHAVSARANSLLAGLRSSFAVLSILTSWALESALDTADSMHARGYGLPGRSAYRPFRFTTRDGVALTLILVCAAVVIIALTSGIVSAQYLPSFLLNQGAASLPAAIRSVIAVGVYGAFGLLCLAPALFELQEEVAWRISRSTI